MSAKRTVATKSMVFFKEVFFAVTIIAAELMSAVAKIFASEKKVVPGTLMSTLSMTSMAVTALAVTPVEVEVALKLAAVMDARVFSKCWFCKCC